MPAKEAVESHRFAHRKGAGNPDLLFADPKGTGPEKGHAPNAENVSPSAVLQPGRLFVVLRNWPRVQAYAAAHAWRFEDDA